MINDTTLYSIEKRLEEELFGAITYIDIEFDDRKKHILVYFEPAYDDRLWVKLKLDLVEKEEELYENIKAEIKDELRRIVGKLKNFLRKVEKIGIE